MSNLELKIRPVGATLVPNRLAAIGDELSEEIYALRQAGASLLMQARKVGELLAEARALVPHGEWMDWVEAHCGFSKSTEEFYRTLADPKAWKWLTGGGDPHVYDLPLREVRRRLSSQNAIVTRSGNDKVMTPSELAAAIVRAVKPSGTILEPAAGTGMFVRALKKYGRVFECEKDRGQNFFNWSQPVDWIVTNPPWSRFRRFLSHSMELAPNIVLLVTVNHFWTTRRVRDVRAAGFGYKTLWLIDEYPKEFVRTGFQLGAMHLKKGWKGALTVKSLPKK